MLASLPPLGGQQKPRIAVFLPTLDFGGVARVMINLARGFLGRGYRVDLVAANATGAFRDHVPSEARLVDLKSRRVLASLPALVRYLRRESPGALVAGMTHSSVVAVCAKKLADVGTKIIATEHIEMSSMLRGSSRWRVRMVPFFARRFLPWADALVAVSKGVADDVSRVAAIPRENIHVIYNPVLDQEFFARAGDELSHLWLKPGSPPVILSVGQLTEQKGFRSLIKAFSLVAQQNPARLLILGEGPDRSRLEGLVADLGIGDRVGMPGFEPNPYAYMARAKVFALASEFEGFGMVLVEALALGANVVTTDCPAGPREILDYGSRGTLVPFGDVNALAQALLAALDAPRRNISRETLNDFEVATAVSSYEQLIRCTMVEAAG